MKSPREDAAEAWKAPDSIPAPIGNDPAGIEFRAVPLSELGPDEPIAWVWQNFVARGHTTLFTGLWKAGKSTMIAHLLRDLASGAGLAQGVPPCEVLVISEESRSIWRRRRDELGIGDHVRVVIRPFLSKVSPQQWERLVAWIADQVREEGFGLVVIDTISGVWPVLNENDAVEVTSALMPVHRITDAGAGLLLVHHPRKGDAKEAQASRGSGALSGFVDTIVELRRYAPDDGTDHRRTLTVYSRIGESGIDTVLELGDEGYAVLGSGADVRGGDRSEQISGLLPIGGPGITVEELHERYPAPAPGVRTLRGDLKAGIEKQRWVRVGTGTRNDAYQYYRVPELDSGNPSSLDAGIESQGPGVGGGAP